MENLKVIVDAVQKYLVIGGLLTVGIGFLAMLVYSTRESFAKIWKAIKAHKVASIILFPLFATLVIQGSTKPPVNPPIETEEGIKLTSVVSERDSVTFKWESTDERIVEGATFQIQRRSRAFPFIGGWSNWSTVKEVTEYEATVDGYTWDRNNQFRIAVLIEAEDETETETEATE